MPENQCNLDATNMGSSFTFYPVDKGHPKDEGTKERTKNTTPNAKERRLVVLEVVMDQTTRHVFLRAGRKFVKFVRWLDLRSSLLIPKLCWLEEAMRDYFFSRIQV